MLDEPIDVLDSHIRFTDAERAAGSLEHLGRADVPDEVATDGRLAANLWRCGWLLNPGLVPEVFQLRHTSSSDASTETSYRAIWSVAYFVAEGSFALLRGGQTTQHLRFWKKRVDFERGGLAFVPASPRGQLNGHVAVGIRDSFLRSIDADFLLQRVLDATAGWGIRDFEVRAELTSRRGRRLVRAAGRMERKR